MSRGLLLAVMWAGERFFFIARIRCGMGMNGTERALPYINEPIYKAQVCQGTLPTCNSQTVPLYKNKRHLRGDAPPQMALNLSYNQSQITDSMSSVFVLPSSVNVTHMPVSKKSVGIYGSSSTSVIDCFNGSST